MADAFCFWKIVDNILEKNTLVWLANKSELNYKTLKNQRSYLRLPNLEDAYAISRTLGVSLEYLLTGTDSLSEAQRIVARDREMEDLVIYLSSHETAKKGLIEAFSLKKGSAVEIVG